MCQNMCVIWLWVTLWRLKTNSRQLLQVGLFFFSICQSRHGDSYIAFVWLNFMLISQTDTDTQARIHTPLTHPSLGSWCWVSCWSPATLEKGRDGREGRGREWKKRPLVFGVYFFSSELSRNPPSLQDAVCFHGGFFFPALLPVITLSFKQLDSPNRMGSFPHLLLPHPSLSLSARLTPSWQPNDS